jgi:hypothetical protein
LRTRRNQLLLDTLSVLAKTQTEPATIQQVKKLFEKEVLEESVMETPEYSSAGSNRGRWPPSPQGYNSRMVSSPQSAYPFTMRDQQQQQYYNQPSYGDGQSWISSVSTHRHLPHERKEHYHSSGRRQPQSEQQPPRGSSQNTVARDGDSAAANVFSPMSPQPAPRTPYSHLSATQVRYTPQRQQPPSPPQIVLPKQPQQQAQQPQAKPQSSGVSEAKEQSAATTHHHKPAGHKKVENTFWGFF